MKIAGISSALLLLAGCSGPNGDGYAKSPQQELRDKCQAEFPSNEDFQRRCFTEIAGQIMAEDYKARIDRAAR